MSTGCSTPRGTGSLRVFRGCACTKASTGALPSVALVNGGLSLHSEALGLEVRHDKDGRLRFHDPESGKDLQAHEEMRERVEQQIAARRAAEARLDETEARLDETEARLRETRTRLDEEAAAHQAARAQIEEAVAECDSRIAELEARLGRAL